MPCALRRVVVAACGGDDDGQDGTATASVKVSPQIEKAIRTAVINSEYGVTAVKVVGLETDDEETVAEVELEGGTLGDQSVEMTLSQDGKGWKVDEITRFVSLDKPLFVERFEAETKSLPENLSPAQVRCLTEEFSKSSQETIETLYLDHAQAAFQKLGNRCKDA